MNSAAREIVATTRRIIGLQVGVSALVALGFYVGKGNWEALSALYGGAISVAVAFLLSSGVARASGAARHSQSMWILYFGAALRFLLVLVLFGAGLGFLKLDPLATVAGFIAAQLMYVSSARQTNN